VEPDRWFETIALASTSHLTLLVDLPARLAVHESVVREPEYGG